MAEQAELPPVLTLWRPWPTLIFAAGKDVENRTWSARYRGPLLIHAGTAFEYGIEAAGMRVDGAAVEWVAISDEPDDHPTGLVGVADLVGVCTCGLRGPLTPAELCSPWAMPGQYHWRLTDPRPFAQPIPCRGHQRLWRAPEQIAPKVRQALKEVTGGE